MNPNDPTTGATVAPAPQRLFRLPRALQERDFRRFWAGETVSLLTDRRRHAPSGLHGGEPGAPGRNLLGTGVEQTELPPKTTLQLAAGGLVTMVTPGGGGWGGADDPRAAAPGR